MSFHTRLEIAMIDEFYGIDWELIQKDILKLLDRDGIHHDVLEDVKVAFREGEVLVGVDAAYLKSFFEDSAELFSKVSFELRGSGEEFEHTFVQRHEDGKVVLNIAIWESQSPHRQKNDGEQILNPEKKYTQKPVDVLDFDKQMNEKQKTSKKIKYKYNF